MTEADVWSNLKELTGKGHIVTASCLKDYNGLQGGHAYTVLDTFELPGDDNKLIQLRSAVESEKYVGPFGNSDPKWTPELKAKIR